ncbi:hypothetical protein ZIOFF_058183 [Zingiber officinale]|uniref:Secretory carrier-associated membrane protein n=1 Tax=Zingiber officinale TaxID=94328 RepID=A0A8J5KHK1_ZINOF|nr:hypothetical protein ZIOFF_058183 [Zingiber officinale]
MSRDPNPFSEEDVNPFANSTAPGSNSRISTLASKAFGFGNKNDARVDIPLDNVNDSKKRERELAAWEENLKQREMVDIKRREDSMTRAGVTIEEKNWPPIFPIIHHDISKEIPVHAQRLQYLAFASWLVESTFAACDLGILLCLSWNVIAVIVCWIRGGGVKIFLLAVIYALLGFPLSYVLWYRPLYRAMSFLDACFKSPQLLKLAGIFLVTKLFLWSSRTDSALRFSWFFFVYLIHIGFCIFAAIAPPIVFHGKSLTGILAAIDTFSDHALVGLTHVALITDLLLGGLWAVLLGDTNKFVGTSENLYVLQRTQVKLQGEELLYVAEGYDTNLGFSLRFWIKLYQAEMCA